MRTYIISNRVIGYEKKLGRSVLEENKYIERKIHSFTDVLMRSDIRKILSII